MPNEQSKVVWGLVNEVASEMGEHTSVEMTDEQMDAIMKKNRKQLEENRKNGLFTGNV